MRLLEAPEAVLAAAERAPRACFVARHLRAPRSLPLPWLLLNRCAGGTQGMHSGPIQPASAEQVLDGGPRRGCPPSKEAPQGGSRPRQHIGTGIVLTMVTEGERGWLPGGAGSPTSADRAGTAVTTSVWLYHHEALREPAVGPPWRDCQAAALRECGLLQECAGAVTQVRSLSLGTLCAALIAVLRPALAAPRR